MSSEFGRRDSDDSLKGYQAGFRTSIQAVVYIDTSFITGVTDNILYPLVNVPILSYALELIESNGINDIFLFCAFHQEQIEDYLSIISPKKANIRVYQDSTCYSIGDALRYIDGLNVITGDFILLNINCVSNMNLRAAIIAHKANFKRDPQTAMTIVLQRMEQGHPSRLSKEDTMFGICPKSHKLLHCSNEHVFTLCSNFKQISLHSDLVESFIYICSPSVLVSFSDNFDYASIQQHYIPGTLEAHDDFVPSSIYTYILQRREYAAHIGDLYTYRNVSTDIIKRKIPLYSPDKNFGERWGIQEFYSYSHKNRYRAKRKDWEERENSISTGVIIEDSTILGNEVIVKRDAVITDSIIGRGCIIGEGCIIQGSILWDGTVVKTGAQVYLSLLAENVQIGELSIVNEGCVIGKQVEIDKKTTVPRRTFIPHNPSPSKELKGTDFNEFKEDGESYSSEQSRDGLKDAEYSIRKKALSIIKVAEEMRSSSIQPIRGFDTFFPETEPSGIICSNFLSSDKGRKLSLSSASDEVLSNSDDDVENVFIREVVETLARYDLEDKDGNIHNLGEELLSLKLAHNVSMEELAKACFFGTFSYHIQCLNNPLIEVFIADLTKESPIIPRKAWTTNPIKIKSKDELSPDDHLLLILGNVIQVLKRFYIRDEDQVSLLVGLQNSFNDLSDSIEYIYFSAFNSVLIYLYFLDAATEKAILRWEKKEMEEHGEDSRFLKVIRPFINWLKSAEEESSDEESEN